MFACPPAPILAPPGDADEPGGSGQPWPGEDDGEGMPQGLYIAVPAGQVTLAGFAQDGEADTMAPGPLLATIVDTVTGQDGSGLAGCSDDQLLGIISAARRLEARSTWTAMAAMRSLFVGSSPRSSGQRYMMSVAQKTKTIPTTTMWRTVSVVV